MKLAESFNNYYVNIAQKNSDLKPAVLRDQVYSNIRVPTQVNTNQYESTRVQHESTLV